MYRAALQEGEHVVIISEVEGPNGFILTNLRKTGSAFVRVFQDTGEGPEEIVRFTANESFDATTGVPLVAGSTITVIGQGTTAATLIGYVY